MTIIKKTSQSTTAEGEQQTPLQLGKTLLKKFLFDPSYHNLNHGSFGTIPKAIQHKLRHYQDEHEARPDQFIRYDFPVLLDESRAAVAKVLNAPVDTVVFVPNATVGINTVLRNLSWDADCKDEILYFSTIYGGCGKTIDYVVDTTYGRVSSRCIPLNYPVEDVNVVEAFKDVVKQAREEGKRPKICLFDVVSSLPGVRFPFEMMARACKEEGVMSLVDGAQGIGMVEIDLESLDPDFFVSNCHKWLLAPRGSAAFYVPLRNQALVPSTLPTSHGYIPKSGGRFNPLPASTKSVFVSNFEFVGTLDNSPYLCVRDAIKWRQDVLGGEERIRRYMWTLAKEGGKKVASILGTCVMDNSTGTLTNCAMVNVALPLFVAANEDTSIRPENGNSTGEPSVPQDEAMTVWEWLTKVLVDEYKTFVPTYVHEGRFWARLSAQVYLDLYDFEWAGQTLKELCLRVAKGEYKS